MKSSTLNYEALNYSKPIKPQLANLLGPGGRLTTGRICDYPLTHENNIRLFEAIDEENKLKEKANQAKKRAKAQSPLPGDKEILDQYAKIEEEGFLIRLEGAHNRTEAGNQTKGDEKLLQSRKARKLTNFPESTTNPPVKL